MHAELPPWLHIKQFTEPFLNIESSLKGPTRKDMRSCEKEKKVSKITNHSISPECILSVRYHPSLFIKKIIYRSADVHRTILKCGEP